MGLKSPARRGSTKKLNELVQPASLKRGLFYMLALRLRGAVGARDLSA